MAELTKQAAARAANDLDWTTSSDDGDTFETNGTEALLVRNNKAGTITLTVTTVKKVDGLDVDNLTIEVAASAVALLGPWPASIYGDVDRIVSIDAGADYADVEYALISIG